MYKALLFYRRLLNSRRCPRFLKRPVVWAYGRLFESLFSDRHTRGQPYPIPVPGHASPGNLWLDWCDYADAWYIFTGGIGSDLHLRFALRVPERTSPRTWSRESSCCRSRWVRRPGSG